MAERGPVDRTRLRDDILEHLEDLGGFDDLVAVWLHGSHAGGQPTPRSDIDIACYYDRPRADLGELSVRLAGRLPDRYDAEVFQLLPLPIRKEVLGGELLWTSDRDRVYDIAYDTLQAWFWFQPMYEEVIA